ncbi:MAG TPA: class I SAM-dependent methyltransferase [Candidatus Binatia bacterium]|nr:class I SAM-dependent methyltransferase [Candidatus Binatia bacterium]
MPPHNESAMQVTAPCPACGADAFRFAFLKRGCRFERCLRCGVMRQNPQIVDLAEAYADAYRTGEYAFFASATGIRRAIAELRLRAVMRAHPRARRWLDLGASTGAFVAAAGAALATRGDGGVAEGVEFAPEAVAAARAEGLAVFQSTVEDFVVETPYDVITAFDVLEHLRDPAVLLERARSWLAPGGILAVTVPNLGSVPSLFMGRHWYFIAPDHLHYFDAGTLRQVFQRNGFAVRDIATTYKVLTIDYAIGALRDRNPWLARIADLPSRLLPASLRDRPWQVPVGEMLAIAAPA